MKYFLLTIAILIAGPALAQDAPLPARVAAEKMTLPDGFKATLFAGEPDVVQPIGFCFDDRGRVWVAECLSYPDWQADPKKGKDRIVILEDTDGDGVHDKRSVFASNIQNISGIQYGFGGVWVCATPNLLFIPIKDDKPAGPPEIVLDGWSLQAKHNVFNSPTWGPDGWLYGCNGITATSRIGRPGAPDKDRVPMNCGVWRYHPTRKKFEVVAHGTTNPWGLDFDEHGEMFITNCVIDHLWHIVPGGHYQRMYGEDFNPHVYKLMPSICDHLHWGGGAWTSSRHPSNKDQRASRVSGGSEDDAYKAHSAAGGGHAHVGCMIYLGDNWPDRYRGGVFMCNLHGSRINHDLLERNGSTYVARHCKDFMLANDPWFRGLAIHYGPDGGVYVSDWTDTGECHNYKVADRTNGRIFKITYGKAKPWSGDLAKLSDMELAQMNSEKNQWLVRHARRLLQERAVKRGIAPEVVKELERQLGESIWPLQPGVNPSVRPLYAFFVLKSVNALEKENLYTLLKHNNESIRSWAIRFLLEDRNPNQKTVEVLFNHASRERSSLVRLHLAGALTALSPDTFATENVSVPNRLGIAMALTELQEDSDPYLPLMYWYAIEPRLVNPLQLGNLQMPLLQEFAARRCAQSALTEGMKSSEMFDKLLDHMARFDEPALHRNCLRGITNAYQGRRNLVASKEWTRLYPILIASPLPEARERALALAVQFGDERAFALLRKIVPDRAHPLKERENALKTLLFQQKADLVPILHELLSDAALRGPAIRGLAAYDDAETPRLLLNAYARLGADEKGDALQTLAARASYVKALVAALETGVVPRADLNSYTIRQLHTVLAKAGDQATTQKLTKLVGEVRSASADKAKLITKYKAELKPEVLKKANLHNGRALYAKACANCHRLFGEGSDIGPDLTGAQRMNLDYVLENVLDPSAIVPREYQVTVIETKNGRTLSGIVKKENDAALTLQLPNDLVVVPKTDIDTRTATKLSMMPEGTFEPMRFEDVRDLVAYLASPVQVGLKK